MLPLLAVLPIIEGLTSVAPSIAKWFGGDKAEARVGKICSVVQSITGVGDNGLAEGVEKIKADPEMQLRFLQELNDHETRWWEEETKQIQTVNETMQNETRSEDPYVRRWRPTWGYLTAVAWFIQILGLMLIGGWSVYDNPAKASEIIAQLAALAGALTASWAMALAVLGVGVLARSKDKQVEATGQPTQGVLDKVLSAFGKGGQ
jgi:hypothetical protein